MICDKCKERKWLRGDIGSIMTNGACRNCVYGNKK